MITQPIIMVQIADREWTIEALHYACRLARHKAAKIELVAMIPVPYATWLGTELGYMNFREQDRADFRDYQATIEDYGLECEPLLFQYMSLIGAIAQVAKQINAQVVFARMPESVIPFWKRFQSWLLNREFVRQERHWIQNPIYYSEASTSVIEAPVEINGLYRHHSIH